MCLSFEFSNSLWTASFCQPVLATTIESALNGIQRKLNQGFQTHDLLILTATLMVLVLIWGTVFFVSRSIPVSEEEAVQSIDLFNELCVAHGVNPKEVECIRERASHLGLNPVELFLLPEVWPNPSETGELESNLFRRLFADVPALA